MARFAVLKLEAKVKEKLRERATAHGRSIEEEIRVIFCTAVARPANKAEELGNRTAEHFSDNPFDNPIVKHRGMHIEPTEFNE